MAFINDKTKEITCKILYCGPPQCGKSTALRRIYCEAAGDAKREAISLSQGEGGGLFFDFVPLNLGEVGGFTLRLHVYTIPGGMGYQQSRALISKGVDGAVFVADSRLEGMEANLKSLASLRELLRGEGQALEEIPHVYQYNKRDLPGALPAKKLRRYLNAEGAPDFETVATTGEGVGEAFRAISALVLRTIRKSAPIQQ